MIQAPKTTAIHVAAAAVFDAFGKVLIAQRPQGKHLAGGWEFPGGKLEAGEDARAGLKRELREELGITIANPRPLIRVRHRYPHGEVLLDVWVVKQYDGIPWALDRQALRWCTQEELAAAELLPADGPIVRALRLPERLTLRSSEHHLVQDAGARQAAVSAGAPRLRGILCAASADAVLLEQSAMDFLVLRGELARGEIAAICAAVSIPVYAAERASGESLTLEEAWALGATGTHTLGL